MKIIQIENGTRYYVDEENKVATGGLLGHYPKGYDLINKMQEGQPLQIKFSNGLTLITQPIAKVI